MKKVIVLIAVFALLISATVNTLTNAVHASEGFNINAQVSQSEQQVKGIETNSTVSISQPKVKASETVMIAVNLLDNEQNNVPFHDVEIKVTDKDGQTIKEVAGRSNQLGVFETDFSASKTGIYGVQVWDNSFEQPLKLLQTEDIEIEPSSPLVGFLSVILNLFKNIFN